jgi:hypothetical protein
MPGGRARTELLIEIRPGDAGTDDLMLDGWGPAEGGHRWAFGGASTVWLPVQSIGEDCVIAIDMVPWCDKQVLPAQRLSLALDGVTLMNIQLHDQRVLAVHCPALPGATGGAVLSLTHHFAGVPRPAGGRSQGGLALSVMVISIRVFRLHLPQFHMMTRAAFPGNLEDGVLREAVSRETGLTLERLAWKFESIGHNCEFGLIQRALGAEPISLLRFTAVITCRLYESLISGFAGLGDADNIAISVANMPGPEFQVHETRHWIFYSTGQPPSETTPEIVRVKQSAHLRILQRKFLETLRSGEKIYSISRGLNLTSAEALAIWCALNLHAENDLLWALNGDISQTGRVDALMPGFLRGHLGATDDRKYGTLDAWVSLMANAWMLRRGLGEPAIFALS